MDKIMTASQTVGPFLHIGLAGLYSDNLVAHDQDAHSMGVPLVIEGRVIDGNGEPVPDGLVEIWQANRHGKYADPQDTRDLPLEEGFRGFGRVATDAQGHFRFTTVKPGRVPGPSGTWQAPHIAVSVFMRGLLKRLITRIYFPDGEGHEQDPVLQQVPPARRATLIARPVGNSASLLSFDIVVQAGEHGYDETVFFDV